MRKDKRRQIEKLLVEVEQYFKLHGRTHLPWRKTRDPYHILVSEVMLQQTQAERVVPFYKNFIKQFSTPQMLAKAPLSEVLEYWQGLGYNRRAKHLREAARVAAKRGFPQSTEGLRALPSVGYYTARAIRAFAYNEPEIFVETNIRTVFMHFCFPRKKKINDEELLKLVAYALEHSSLEPRDFYAALMDYGAYLKAQGIRINHRSAHYAKQPKFEGSARQLRGAILRELIKHKATLAVLAHRIPRNQEELARELSRLTAEGLVALHGRYFSISN